MQFRLGVTPATGGWSVSVFDAASGQPVLDSNGMAVTREMVALPGKPAYPIAKTGMPIVSTGTHDELVDVASSAALRNVHEAIVARTRRPAILQRFGRYLFETLIGQDAWDAILATAGSRRIELSLSWKPEDTVLNRLPWELVHDGKRFLAQAPGVAILRRVADAPQKMPDLRSPPRVLFVVGTELYKDVIEPGAEYLRLIQGLKARELDLSLRTLLVLKCTSLRLQAALEDFTPDVVHFICHGRLDELGQGYLELVDPKNAAKPAALFSGSLLTMWKAQKAPPPVIVLSACYTATAEFTDVGQVAVPFAADLVRNGVPIVVGMGGRIADQSCRLFTRQFYESLLTGGDIAHATAEGRRAAISHGGTDAMTSVDWALPVIFFASGVEGTSVPVTLQTEEQAWQGFSGDFRNGEDPVFCDRLEVLEQFDILMSSEETQRRVGGRDSDLQALAIAVPKPDSAEKYGRTWLLHELAVKAIQDGHVPCLVCEGEAWSKGDYPPGDVDQLLRAIQSAVDITRYRFGITDAIPTACPLVEALLNVPEGGNLPPDLPAEILAVTGDEATRSARRKAVALRLDLLALLDAAAAKRPPDDIDRTRLVLLIDDVHRMGHRAVSDFFGHLSGAAGLRTGRKRIRYAFTYSSVPITAQELSVKAITDSLRSWTGRLELGPFKPTIEERQAYQHYLLNWRTDGKLRPLVAEMTLSDWVFSKLTAEVAGIPSNLLLKAPPVIRTFLGAPKPFPAILRDADDQTALAQARGEIR